MERFAPDMAAAMQLVALLDDAANQLAAAESMRDAYDVDNETAALLAEAAEFADGRLHGLADALGLLLGRDALTLHTEASARAVERRAARVREFEELIGLCP